MSIEVSVLMSTVEGRSEGSPGSSEAMSFVLGGLIVSSELVNVLNDDVCGLG